jgi:hypothetical protein
VAKMVFTNGYVLVNGVDLSDHAVSIEVDGKAEDIETTSMGAAGKGRLPGLRDEAIKIKWRQDFAASKVDATLAPLYTGGTSFAIEIRPVNSARSTTNPAYTATVYLLDYNPIAGEVGKVLDVDTTFTVDGVMLRQTS